MGKYKLFLPKLNLPGPCEILQLIIIFPNAGYI